MYRINWTWAILTVVLAAATALLVAFDAQTPLRPWITLAFLLICPGMAFVALLRLRDPISEVVLAVTLSLVLELAVASIMVYGNFWTAERTLVVVIALSTVGLLCQLFLWQWSLWRSRRTPIETPSLP